MTTAAADALIADIAGFQHDPLGYVLYAFPWAQEGTELANESGPRLWQRDALNDLGAMLRAGVAPGVAIREVIQLATASGHGIGKSAFVSWLIMWGLSTFEDTKVVVTANTENQLNTKTWPEVGKWHRLAINSHWFKFTATAVFSLQPKHEKTWRADAIPWSENNTEAFAGLHNKGKRIILIFDEASAIANKVWDVAEGALTDEDTEIIWAVFGNYTRNTGRFHECFGSLKHRWRHRQIDSRQVEGTNKAQIAKWVEDYGEDSDFVRVRVRGLPPRAGSNQFIPSDIVAAAAVREAVSYLEDPLIMAVDVARFGQDESAIRFRRGLDARTIQPVYLQGIDLMTLVGRVAALANEHKPDVIFVDETGMGAGVVDRLRQLGYHVIGVNNGAKPDSASIGSELVARKDAEMWAKCREWLKAGAIDNDAELKAQLEGREFSYNVHNAIMLEPKDMMKKRGLSSPDRADALVLTFAHPVAQRMQGGSREGTNGKTVTEYDPYA